MEPLNCEYDKWFYLCLSLVAVIAIMLVMFFNYSLKIKDRNINLEKQERDHNFRIKELEKKNGHELEQIKLLKIKVQTLEKLITDGLGQKINLGKPEKTKHDNFQK